MRYKAIAFVVVIVALGSVHLVEAQQPAKVYRMGVLISASPSIASRRIQAFQQGLRELGYVEGKNIIIEYRYAEGKLEPLADLADDLVRLKLDVIVTDTSMATQAAKNATKIAAGFWLVYGIVVTEYQRWQERRSLDRIAEREARAREA